jgi:ribosome maturation factor RimP
LKKKDKIKKDNFLKPENRKQGSPVKPKKPDIRNRVWKLAEPFCGSLGLELVEVEYQREQNGRVLRLYIDKPGGPTLDDCVYVSRHLGDLLDANLEQSGSYHLEVSSPGPERPLVKPGDFERFKGKSAKIKTRSPIGGQRNFTGIINGIKGETVLFSPLNRPALAIEFRDIAKAKLADSGL